MRLMRESIVLIVIGLADLVYTLKLVRAGNVTEGNPIMGYYLQVGVGAFVLVKLGLLFLPVFVAEWSKLYKPRFVKLMLRGAIIAYLGSYLVMYFVINVAPRFRPDGLPPVRVVERTR